MRGARLSIFLLAVALGCQASAPVPRPAAAPAAPVLRWDAPRRHVHIDNVALDRVEVFEGARKRWLMTLRASGGYLPDGRPLFWSSTHDGVRTFFTFYPFATWADLQARSDATGRTETRVGKAALTDYDSGDAALVPPHASELWWRLPDLDFAPTQDPKLDERTASRAWIEFRAMPMGAESDAVEALLPKLRAALKEAELPLTGMAFRSLYGRGELVFLWLARDAATLESAAARLRELAARPDLAPRVDELERLLPLRQRLTLERREELANLPDAPVPAR